MALDLLSPLNDYVFKQLFGQPERTDILADFLQAVLDLPASEYKALTIIDPHLPGELPDDKTGILDVKILTTSGKIIDVEVQVRPEGALHERILFYTTRMLAGQLGEGESYEELKKVISIILAGHRLLDTFIDEDNRKKPGLAGKSEKKADTDFHHQFILYDPVARLPFPSQLLEIHTLELPKLPIRSSDKHLWAWLRFFSAKNESEFLMTTKNNPVIEKAYRHLKKLSADERSRLLAAEREKAARDEISRISHATRKGRTEAIRETALAGLKKNYPIEMIMDFTGLTRQEIENLKKTL